MSYYHINTLSTPELASGHWGGGEPPAPIWGLRRAWGRPGRRPEPARVAPGRSRGAIEAPRATKVDRGGRPRDPRRRSGPIPGRPNLRNHSLSLVKHRISAKSTFPLRGRLGGDFGRPGSPFGAPGRSFWLPRSLRGRPGAPRGAPGALPGAPWERFWRSLGALGRSRGAFGHPWGPQGAPGGDSGSIFVDFRDDFLVGLGGDLWCALSCTRWRTLPILGSTSRSHGGAHGMATKVHDRLSGAIDACAIGLLSATLRDSVHKLDSSII